MAVKNFLFSSVPNILCELGSSVKVNLKTSIMGIVNYVHSILMKGQRMMGFKLFEDVYFIIFHGQVGSIAKTLGCRAVVVVTDPGLRFTFQIKTKNQHETK